MSKNLKKCSKCVCDDSIPGFEIDDNNICNYCKLYDDFDEQYKIDDNIIDNIIQQIKKVGKNNKYDCVIGISGGCDSSYLLYSAIKWGLRPIAVHYNNGWNTEIATSNMKKIITALNVPFEEYFVELDEVNDIWKAFLRSGVRDIEAPTDIGLTALIYQVAAKHNIKYILGGHSFRTEGVTPLGVSYMDGKYISDIHKQFGSMPMETFPNLWLLKWMYWMFIKNIVRIRPLYHINYIKNDVKKLLKQKFDWEWYGQHHGENVFTTFFGNYYRNHLMGIDGRLTEFSALIRSGQMTRDNALEQLKQPVVFDGNIDDIRIKLNMSKDEWGEVLTYPTKTHNDFKTYKSTFKKLKPLFWLAYKRNLIPKTFYTKYCQ